MNFIFGLTDLEDDFDILNNPYVDVLGYALVKEAQGKGQEMVHKYKIGKCDDEHLARFMPEHTRAWYD